MQNKDNAKLVPLSELIVSINSGLNPRNNFKLNEDDGTCLYINVKNLQANEGDMQMCDRIPISAMEMIKKKCNLEIGDILIPAIFTNKPLAIMVNENLKNIGMSENVYAIKPNDKVDGRYLLYMLRTSFVQNQIKKMVDNKQLARITKNMLKEILIPLEEADTQHRIANFMCEIDRVRLVMSIMQSKMNFVSENFVTEINEHLGGKMLVYVYDSEREIEDITEHASQMYKQISKIQNDIIDQKHNKKRRMKNEKN